MRWRTAAMSPFTGGRLMQRSIPALLAAFSLLACDGDLLGPRRRPRTDGITEARSASASLGASASSATQVYLSWTDYTPNEDGWEVWRSTTGATGTFTLLASLPANSTSYVNGGLAPETEYCYKVRSFRRPGPNS